MYSVVVVEGSVKYFSNSSLKMTKTCHDLKQFMLEPYAIEWPLERTSEPFLKIYQQQKSNRSHILFDIVLRLEVSS